MGGVVTGYPSPRRCPPDEKSPRIRSVDVTSLDLTSLKTPTPTWKLELEGQKIISIYCFVFSLLKKRRNIPLFQVHISSQVEGGKLEDIRDFWIRSGVEWRGKNIL
ncbi:hypothetical protein NC652_017385 [Populus alba x Populus x berolinensis]|nr:hypothetical protein NC652_017385 [Populus alba x Populus x berolinensis]